MKLLVALALVTPALVRACEDHIEYMRNPEMRPRIDGQQEILTTVVSALPLPTSNPTSSDTLAQVNSPRTSPHGSPKPTDSEKKQADEFLFSLKTSQDLTDSNIVSPGFERKMEIVEASQKVNDGLKKITQLQKDSFNSMIKLLSELTSDLHGNYVAPEKIDRISYKNLPKLWLKQIALSTACYTKMVNLEHSNTEFYFDSASFNSIHDDLDAQIAQLQVAINQATDRYLNLHEPKIKEKPKKTQHFFSFFKRENKKS